MVRPVQLLVTVIALSTLSFVDAQQVMRGAEGVKPPLPFVGKWKVVSMLSGSPDMLAIPDNQIVLREDMVAEYDRISSPNFVSVYNAN